MDEINIWELGIRINVKVSKNFLALLNQEISTQYKSKIEFWKLINYKIPFTTFKGRLKPCYQYYTDLEIFLESCKLLNISLDYFQENIVGYKTRRGTNQVIEPILPIKITPIFEMLLAHNMGDGTVINPKRGRMPYFGYRQFDEFLRVNFVKKLEALFGKIKYKENYFLKSTRPYCPASLSQLFFSYYNLKIEDFLSDRARIPETIFKKSWEHQLSFLLGIIIDEGHIDSTTIVIGLKNRNLTRDIEKLCKNLNYECRYCETKGKYKEDYGYLYILKKGLVKFWQDYNLLKMKYPEINLGYKEKQIETNLRIQFRKIKRIKGNDKIILDLLSKQNYTVNEIARQINMTRQGVKYHIHNLERDGKINKIGIKGENNFIYSIL